MNREEVESVLDHYCLTGGEVWTLPILLQTNKSFIKKQKLGDSIALVDKRTEEIFAVLQIDDIFEINLQRFNFEVNTYTCFRGRIARRKKMHHH